MLCTQDFFKNITYTNFKYLEIVLCAHTAQDFFYRIFMEISVANLVSMVHIKKKIKTMIKIYSSPILSTSATAMAITEDNFRRTIYHYNEVLLFCLRTLTYHKKSLRQLFLICSKGHRIHVSNRIG